MAVKTEVPEGVTPPSALDPAALLRSPDYLKLLVLAAILGVPISAAAYWFLYLVDRLQTWTYNASDLPKWLGFSHVPVWWPLFPLAIAGVLVGVTVRSFPGAGGHSPADGFKAGAGPPMPVELPGIVLTALATLASGVVLGPEAPLIALGAGLAFCAVRIAAKDAPPRTAMVVAGRGELRRHQRPHGLTDRRCFLSHGGVGFRRPHAEPPARPRPPGLGHRLSHLRRLRLVDRPPHLRPRHLEPPPRGLADGHRVPLGHRHRPDRRRSRHRHPVDRPRSP